MGIVVRTVLTDHHMRRLFGPRMHLMKTSHPHELNSAYLFHIFFVSRSSSGTRSTPRASTPLANSLDSRGPSRPYRLTMTSSVASSCTGRVKPGETPPFCLPLEMSEPRVDMAVEGRRDKA